jgi:hypothetical protein
MKEHNTPEPNDESELEKKLYSAEDMPAAEDISLYMPKGSRVVKGMLERMRTYWNTIKPRNVPEAVAAVVMPAPYHLWKLPVEVHEKLNDILGVAAGIATVAQPEVGLATGIAYGISQVIYGLKTGSGKHTGSGLMGIVEHVKKLDLEEHKPLIDKIEGIIHNYFHNFNPAYAT